MEADRSPCCAPRAERGGPARAAEAFTPRAGAERQHGFVPLNGGTFAIGSEDRWAYPADGEGPVRDVTVAPFSIISEAVSNACFADFAEETGYETDAERFGWSFVFAGLLPDDFPPTQAVAGTPWWRRVDGADWRHPEGPQSSIADRFEHPVVHVSWDDAAAYCSWAGTRLPTEAEWEFAARGGLAGNVFPWGDEREPGGEHRMNVWQGRFPVENTRADGHYGTCSVSAFPPNAYGLHNMTGNVWEWTADWFDPAYRLELETLDPTGPSDGELRVQKGGSYLCHDSYCRRYRVAGRQGNSPDGSAGNVGFRCARDA